jgi:glycosyltransferase involved in cell wall biosynthesis
VHVLVVSPGHPDVGGGVEQCVKRLLRYLSDWNVEWTLLYRETPDQANLGLSTSFPGGEVVPIRTRSGMGLGRLEFAIRAQRAMRKLSFDVVHIHGLEYGWAIASMRRLRRQSFTLVATSHGSLRSQYSQSTAPTLLHTFVGHGLSALENVLAKKADAIAAVSSIAVTAVERVRKHDDSVVLIPNAIDLATFSANIANSTNHDIVWIGRQSAYKNGAGAVALFHATRELVPDAQLVLVGDFESDEPQVVNRGRLSPTEIADLLRNSALLLNTSHFEGDPLTVKEALATGLPVAISDAAAAGLPEVFPTLTFPVPDPSDDRGVRAIASKVADLLLSPAERYRLRDVALANRELLSPEREMRQYRQFYEEHCGLQLQV